MTTMSNLKAIGLSQPWNGDGKTLMSGNAMSGQYASRPARHNILGATQSAETVQSVCGK